MSTIDPTQIDPTKPPDGSGDPAAPVSYEPVEERNHKAEVQTQFGNAKTDIEGLESGKADQSALDSHVNAANPHSGSASSADLTAHTGDTNNPHSTTAAQVGAVPDVATADGDLVSYDGTQYTKFGVGTDGQVLTSRPGAGVGAKLAWETIASGGGGIQKGTTFVVGGLLEVESAAGDGTARTHASGLTAAETRAHLDVTSGNPHGTSAADVGAAPDTHVGSTGAAQHGVATTGAAGFMPQLNNNAATYLDGTGAFSTPAGGAGAPAPYRFAVADAEDREYPGGFASSAQTATRMIAISKGGGCTIQLNADGVALTGFSATLADGVKQDISPAGQAIADADEVTLAVSGTGGATPEVSVTLIVA